MERRRADAYDARTRILTYRYTEPSTLASHLQRRWLMPRGTASGVRFTYTEPDDYPAFLVHCCNLRRAFMINTTRYALR